MPTVLIVEHDRGLAELMRELLRSNGMECVACTDDSEALQHLHTNRYALVVCGDGVAVNVSGLARNLGMPLLWVTADLRRFAALERAGQAPLMRPFKIADFLAAASRERMAEC